MSLGTPPPKKRKMAVHIELDNTPISLSLHTTADVHAVVQTLNLQEQNIVITHDSKEILLETHLVDLDISKAKPIRISTFKVHYNIEDSRVMVELTSKFERVSDFCQRVAYSTDWVAMYNNVLITRNTDTLLLHLPTSSQKPLMIRFKSERLKLPALPTGVTIECCETVGDLCELLKRLTGDNYTVGFSGDPYQQSDDLGQLIFSMRSNQKIQVNKVVTHVLFKYGAGSASDTVRTSEKRQSVMDQVNYYNLYSNWFAMEVFNHLTADQNTQDLANRVKKVMSFDNYSHFGRFSNREELYTAVLSEVFTKFLESDNHCCLHQVPLHTGSRPDLYMASLDDGLSKIPKLVGDFKKTDEDKAIAESFVYCQQMMHNSKDFLPIFAMPATLEAFWLYLCIPQSNGRLACIAIAENIKVQNVEDLAKFFSAMKYGVTKLTPLTMFGNTCFSFLPTKKLRLLDTLNTSERVFHNSGFVYKLYDTSSTPFQPNDDIIKLVDHDYLPDLCVIPLKASGRKMLRYKYIEETNEPPKLEWFQSVLDVLEVLHGNGIVHSDVRDINLVYTAGGVIKLIDFDFAGKVGELYPDTYNALPDERHPEARPGEPRKLVHDICAVIKIIFLRVFLTSQQKAYLRRCLDDESIPVRDVFSL